MYFSEALIIFTSDLGIYSTAPDASRRANVTTDQAFEEVRSRVRTAIEANLINPLARALFDRDGTGPVAVSTIDAGSVTALDIGDA